MKAHPDAKPNRLVHEKSPYLLQHAYNPVDWYAWGEEAFKAAEAEDKPVFLSIGYSTCHWCHVMEHESFEDSSVAALMNEAFINIKVDREERPDVDDVYMTVCQMMTGHGGWPLTILMTPDKRPFFAATYIPKETRFNRMGMLDLVPRIRSAWQNEREKVLESAREVTDYLRRSVQQDSIGEPLEADLLRTAYAEFSDRFDAEHGGFGESPKFPMAHSLMFLLRYYERHQEPRALEMVELTLQQMRRGGIYDHVGHGFHRYSTDGHWLLPHFEKMLYDQALLAMAFTEAYQITGNALYRQTVEQILGYVLRDMTGESGGFYTAEDADSEGEEGKFYVWSAAEVLEVAGKDEGKLFNRVYNIVEEGNFEDEATGRRTGTNIPHLTRSLEETAAELGSEPRELAARLEKIRRKLFTYREKRVRPLKDDKVLTDWNGLMIAAFSKAAAALGDERFHQAAVRGAEFVRSSLYDPESGRLKHRFRGGEVAIDGYIDDYAFMIWGLLELYQAGQNPDHLEWAIRLTNTAVEWFSDDELGGFFFTAHDGEELPVRKKEFYDGAIPSGNAVMMYNLMLLSRLTGTTDFEGAAEQAGRAASAQLHRYPSGHTIALIALDFALGPTTEIVITGTRGSDSVQEMLQRVHTAFLPRKVLLFRPSGEDGEPLARLAPFTGDLAPLKGEATAYVCRNFACELPTTDPQQMMTLIKKADRESADPL